MMTQHDLLMREKTLFRYSGALERGDFDTVSAILQEAERDPELEQMILELNEVYQAEWERQQRPAQSRARRGAPEHRRPFRFRVPARLPAIAAAVIVIVVVGIAGLTLMGPRIGGVFSDTVASLDATYYPPPGQPGGGGQANWAAGDMPPMEFAPMMPTGTPALMMPAGTPMPEVAATLPSVAGGGGGPAATPQPLPEGQQERLIIKNGDIHLLVEDTNRAIDQVAQIAADNGGYVLSTQTWAVGEGRSASMTIAVRAENFETSMRRLRDIALEVLQESSSGQDVSAEYVDLQSRLRNLEATRDRLRTFLDEAATVEEALMVNAQLSQIESEIEQVIGRMTYLSGRAAFSTINVMMDMTAPEPTPSPWSLLPRIEAAAQTQVKTFHGLIEALLWIVIVPGPYLVVLGLIVLGVVALRHRRRN
jgi:hypothetical protein